MANELYFLSDSDRRIIQAMIDREKRGVKNPSGRPSSGGADGQEQQGPEVYVALAPASGIPRRIGIEPGSAQCQVYRIVEEVVGTGIDADLVAVTGTYRKVWNLSAEAVGAGEWIGAVRDKFGSWLAVTLGAADDNTGTGTGTGTGTDNPPDTPGGGACNLARLKSTDCLLAEGPENSIELRPLSRTVWESSSDPDDYLTYFGGTQSGQVRFWYAEGRIHLSVGGLELLWCGDGCFTGGPLTGHERTGTDTTGDCAGEVFTVCVTCQCCSICGYDGEGWYCVRTASTGTATATSCPETGTGTAFDDCCTQYLTDADRCDDTIVICSGPYATENEAACIVDGWGGAGWYCIEDDAYTGTATGTDYPNCTVVELLESDRCDEIVICSGPYSTQNAALVHCGPDTGTGTGNSWICTELEVPPFFICEEQGVPGGTYSSLAACEAACPPP